MEDAPTPWSVRKVSDKVRPYQIEDANGDEVGRVVSFEMADAIVKSINS